MRLPCILVKNCKDNLVVIQSDKKLDELKEKYKSFSEKRKESIKDMETIIDNFKKSLENPKKSYKNLIKDCLDKEINNISFNCTKILENKDNFKEFSKDRDKWLNEFISYGIRNALERTNTEVSNYLEEDFKSLIISLRPILEKLINN